MFMKYIEVTKRSVYVFRGEKYEKVYSLKRVSVDEALKLAKRYRDRLYYQHKTNSNTGYKHIILKEVNGHARVDTQYTDSNRGIKFRNTIYINKDKSYEEALRDSVKALSAVIGVDAPMEFNYRKGLKTLASFGLDDEYYLFKVDSKVATCVVIARNAYEAKEMYYKTLINIVHGNMYNTNVITIDSNVESITKVCERNKNVVSFEMKKK